jgi:hypothetical protein
MPTFQAKPLAVPGSAWSGAPPTRKQVDSRLPPLHSPCVLPEKIEVLDSSGRLIFWADEDQARELLKRGQATLVQRKGKARYLLGSDQLTKYGELTRGRGNAFTQTRYSHNRETEENPERVWTLVRLPRSTRRVFLAVVEQCAKRKAKVVVMPRRKRRRRQKQQRLPKAA